MVNLTNAFAKPETCWK